MATYVPAKRATAYRFWVSLVSQTDTKKLQSNPTLAAGDVKVIKDGGAAANLTTLPAVAPASSVFVQVDLSATEMTADNVSVAFIDAAGAEWCDLMINIQTAARQVDDLAFPTTSGRNMDIDASGGVEVGSFQTGAITAGAFTAGAIDAAAIADNAIDAGAIAADAITAAKIANGAIDAATFAASAIDATAIASNAITSAKIATGAITNATFAAGAIDAAAIADNAIDAGAIAADAITAAKIAANAIGASEIADGAIDAATFAASAITATAIAADAITAAKIADGAIDAATFAAGAIDATAIADGAIDAATFAASAITATVLATDAIGAAEVSAAAGAKIADIVLRRTTANIEASANGDAVDGRSLYGAIARLVHKWSIAGTTRTITKSDDTTSLTTESLTATAGADPVTTVDPA